MLTLLRSNLARDIAPVLGCPPEKILEIFEIPKDVKFGHLSCPVFWLAKELKKAPPVIAKELTEKIRSLGLSSLEKIEPVAGFINFYFKPAVLFQSVIGEYNRGPETGRGNQGRGKKLVIDYSSPNVAKPMHIGHLRATVIGQAVRNLAETQGFEVVGLNHLGDWGSQFGKLAWAYKKWGHEFPFATDPFESLYSLYVKFHQECETHPEYEKEGALTFKRLEEGDPEITALWKQFIDISMKDFEVLWARLGVRHDLVRGESFYNDRLDDVVKRLEAKKLLVESEGALVVDLSDDGMPPCLIRKTDGASLYATRDLASAIYRKEELKADLNFYVVGSDQSLHFKQVFKVLEKMGYAWADDCHHIGFGLVRFKDGAKISSRKGNIIRFADVLNKAVELVKGIIREKNPALARLDEVAEIVAVGAITFNDLVNDRVKNVEFDWERALSFDGDSGPYVQYCHVRCASILRKAGFTELARDITVIPESLQEIELMKTLLEFELTLSNAFDQLRPNILANYLLELCSVFNRFYQAHRILGGDERFVPARLALVEATRHTLERGLAVLNIKAPAEM